MSLLNEFFQGSKLILSRCISYVENQEKDYQKLLARLYPKTGRAYRVGITGPPGVGKSSLVDKLTYQILDGKKKVGIIAIDPTSPFTGGAFLGDRIRMQELSTKNEVFIRSMASRGSSGGLAVSTKEVALILDAFGKDYILIETVGVGQVELDIAEACDTTVVVLTPEAGDSIQALKAGLMEISDLFVINKADRPGADKLAAELNMILDSKRKLNHWKYPVLTTSAVNEQGIDLLWKEISAHRDFIIQSHILEKKRKNQIRQDLRKILTQKIKQLVEEKVFVSENENDLIEKLYLRKSNPYAEAEKLFSKINLEPK